MAELDFNPEWGARVFSIGGPTGVGKSSIIKAVLAQFPEDAVFFPRTTTRPPRLGECQGGDYVFASREEFLARQQTGRMVGVDKHKGVLYGIDIVSMRSQLTNAVNGQRVIMIGGICGVALKLLLPAMTNIFVTAELNEIALRLRERECEATVIAERLAWARQQQADQPLFDVVVYNRQNLLEEAVRHIITLMGIRE